VALFAAALREQPALNAVIEGNEIVELDEVHVGFAVATTAGLVVPVVHEADQRPFAEIVATVGELGERARAGALRPDDVGGGTATITNLGAHGVDAFTPIINPPQAVILGIGRIRPAWDDERWLARPAGVPPDLRPPRHRGAGAADRSPPSSAAWPTDYLAALA
jgi:pyruvate dehydrogenase E2 component (dihydrolipoamide acetyltransferase)